MIFTDGLYVFNNCTSKIKLIYQTRKGCNSTAYKWLGYFYLIVWLIKNYVSVILKIREPNWKGIAFGADLKYSSS